MLKGGMSRSARLLDLLQILRRHRQPVTGRALAAELGISLRSLYRDIASLQAQGATIEGEPGLGYVLRPGFMLPPLMFQDEEIEALMLGARFAIERGDAELGEAARQAMAKIIAVLPEELRRRFETETLLVAPAAAAERDNPAHLPLVRQALRAEHKLRLRYLDLAGRESERVVWPVALGFFDHLRMLVAWCELRQGFRHFRLDRIEALELLPGRYPKRRAALLREWRAQEGIPENE